MCHEANTTGTPPLCPANTCTDANYQCVHGACNGQACCLPKPATWKNLPGYEVAAQPASNTIKVLHPAVPYNQLDGGFGTTGGSEPAYNLSTYLNTMYKNNRQVTLLTGANGPGAQDVWMSGYLDGCSDIMVSTRENTDAGAWISSARKGATCSKRSLRIRAWRSRVIFSGERPERHS